MSGFMIAILSFEWFIDELFIPKYFFYLIGIIHLSHCLVVPDIFLQ